MQTTLQYKSLPFSSVKTYVFAALFIAGNLIFPRLFHAVPEGGPTWLPIYFFTLIGAYMFGWRVGLLTALVSPLLNHLLFSMPGAGVLPAIIAKSCLLAVIAGYTAKRFGKVSLLSLLIVVAGYQIPGSLFEWALYGDFTAAIADFRLGIPGMLLQICGARLLLPYLLKHSSV